MTTKDTTGDKLVSSIRRTKSASVAKPQAAATPASKPAAPKPTARKTTARRAAAAKSAPAKPAAAKTAARASKTGGAYQSSGRVWPD